MNINEVLAQEVLNEGRRYFKTSATANKLIRTLRKRRHVLKGNIRKELDPERKRQMRRDIFAINKTLPIIDQFEKYFLELEKTFIGMSEREKKNKIKSHYDEIRFLFLEKLYKTMNIVGKGSAWITASAIAALLFAIIVIPGGTAVMLLPTLSVLRNVNRAKEKVNDKNFTKDLNYLSKQLKKYQS